MSKLTFTPGDWTVSPSTHTYGNYIIEEAEQEQKEGFSGDDDSQMQVERRDYGNALLISAAPVFYGFVEKLRSGEVGPEAFAEGCLRFAAQLDATYMDVLKALEAAE